MKSISDRIKGYWTTSEEEKLQRVFNKARDYVYPELEMVQQELKERLGLKIKFNANPASSKGRLPLRIDVGVLTDAGKYESLTLHVHENHISSKGINEQGENLHTMGVKNPIALDSLAKYLMRQAKSQGKTNQPSGPAQPR